MLNKSVKLPKGLSSVMRRLCGPGVAVLLDSRSQDLLRLLERPPKLSNGLSQRIRSSLTVARCRESFSTAASAPILKSRSRRRLCATCVGASRAVAPWKGVYHADRKAPECVRC